MELTFLAHIFPKDLLQYFKITQFWELGNLSDKSHFYQIHLEENNVILGEIDQDLYESKGFTEVTLQDFPIRGKAVFLVFKRRRWRLKSDKTKIVRNDFSFVSDRRCGRWFWFYPRIIDWASPNLLKDGHQYW